MKTNTLRRNAGIAASAVALSVSLAACGSDSSEETSTGSDTPSSSAPETEESTPAPEPSESESESESAGGGAEGQTFGEGCKLIPASGAGSFNGMVQDPVATAASTNPLLKTLTAAVGQAGLVDPLNTAKELTVFAPADTAFEKIPTKDLNAVLKDKQLLTQILTHHVIPKQLGPDEIAGTQDTLNNDTLTIKGNAEQGVTVENAGGPATVLCGNIPTANATVYVIDTLLMP